MNRAAHLLLALGLLVAPAAARADGPACDAPPDLLEAGASLPATAQAATAGAIRILVVGGASILGPGTSGPAAAWPARMEAAFRARRPDLKLEVVVRGARGLTASDTAAIIAAEMAQAPVHLVLWQTGMAEAVRNLDLDEMIDALNAGLSKLQAAGADAVLIDHQFSRFLRANANVEAYLVALRLVAAAHAVPVLKRWDLMRFWADSDRIDLERTTRADRTAMTDKLNKCLGEAIVALIRDGVAEARGRTRARQ